MRARHAPGPPTAIACGALFDLFERQELPTLACGTQEAYRDSLKPLRAYFVAQLGDPAIDRVRAKDVTGYLAWRRVARMQASAQGEGEARPVVPLASRTLQKDRAVLHRIFALAERLEYRDGNPVARVAAAKADGRDPVILSADEYERRLTACGGADRPMLALYVLTLGEAGLRCESEALRLRWEDVDLEQGFLWIASGRDGHRTKGGKGRWVPMTGRLAAAMRAHFAAFRLAGRSPWVLHHVVTRARQRAGDRIGSLRPAFAAAAGRAELPAGLHQHDLRHRRVTTWLAEERNPVHVKEALGHADLRTTMAYTQLAREHLRSLTARADGAPVVESVVNGAARRPAEPS